MPTDSFIKMPLQHRLGWVATLQLTWIYPLPGSALQQQGQLQVIKLPPYRVKREDRLEK